MTGGDDGPELLPKRYAIKFNPPRFILEYTDGQKTRIRSVCSQPPFHAAALLEGGIRVRALFIFSPVFPVGGLNSQRASSPHPPTFTPASR